MHGTMKHEVSLAGVIGMVLERGRRVRLVSAINLGNNGNRRWYASPADGRWTDGVSRNPDDSIIVDEDDIELD